MGETIPLRGSGARGVGRGLKIRPLEIVFVLPESIRGYRSRQAGHDRQWGDGRPPISCGLELYLA
jgi:hypothetical protein